MKQEILKLIRRRQFILVFGILLAAAVLDFLITCKGYFGVEYTWVRSAYRCTILNNERSLFTSQFYGTLFPLLVCIAGSDLYYEERQMGMINLIETRMSGRKNLWQKWAALAVTTFFLVLVPLGVNLLLALSAFPVQGAYASNAVYLTLTDSDPNRILSYLENFYPYLNQIVYIVIRALLGVGFALFAFSVSVLTRFTRYVVIFMGMIFYVGYVLVTGFSESMVLNTDLFGINTYGSLWMILGVILFLLVISMVNICVGMRREQL